MGNLRKLAHKRNKRDLLCAKQVAPVRGDPPKTSATRFALAKKQQKQQIYIYIYYRSLGAKRVAPVRGDPHTRARPALHWPGSSKTSKFIYKSWRNPGRTDLGSWSYWAPTSHRIPFIHLAKSETLSKPVALFSTGLYTSCTLRSTS